MKFDVWLKYWFFRHYLWVLCLILIGVTIIFIDREEKSPTFITSVGATLSLTYFIQKQKLEEPKLFRELFKEFNIRYNRMNEILACIAQPSEEELSPKEREHLIDYFNLCGEEYLYFKRGYIDPAVWRAWHNGMKAIVSVPRVRAVWEKENATDSYYDLHL